MNTLYSALIAPMQRTRVDVFENIFLVFLGLGTLVGVVVIAYTLYNAYKYRDTGEPESDDEDLPSVGELPTGGKGGKKLFLSFGISAVIVISLVIWTYGMLLYVEDPGSGDDEQAEALEVEVTGQSFAWYFEYENGIESTATLRVPAEERVWLQVTSGDVWHAFGVPDQRVKADAIPGEYDQTWFEADEPGQHEIECFELCGEYHTSMVGTLEVMPQDEFDQWMDNQLTMRFTVEDGNESPVTEGYELTLEHQENDSIEDRTFTAEEFDNGTIEITDIEQAGQYNVTIESTDGQFDTVEDQFDMTGPVDETYTLEMNETEANESDTNDGGEN